MSNDGSLNSILICCCLLLFPISTYINIPSRRALYTTSIACSGERGRGGGGGGGGDVLAHSRFTGILVPPILAIICVTSNAMDCKYVW